MMMTMMMMMMMMMMTIIMMINCDHSANIAGASDECFFCVEGPVWGLKIRMSIYTH